MLRDLIRKRVIKAHQVDIEFNENLPRISLRIGKIHVAFESLMYLILRDMKAKDFITKEVKKWGEDLVLEVEMGGKKEYNIGDFESVYEHVLLEAEKDKLYIEERKQRGRLINELEAFLEQIRVFVDIE